MNRDGRGDREQMLNCLKFFHASKTILIERGNLDRA